MVENFIWEIKQTYKDVSKGDWKTISSLLIFFIGLGIFLHIVFENQAKPYHNETRQEKGVVN